MIAASSPPEHPKHTLAEYLLMNAKPETLATILCYCAENVPMAGDILWLLVANGGDLNVEFARFSCKARTLLLQFSRNIRDGKAAIPGFRLYWHYKHSTKEDRSRECIAASSGDMTEQFDSQGQRVAREPMGPNLRELITSSGLSIQQLAEKSGASWMSLETFVAGKGKLLPKRAYDIAKALNVMSEDVRAAYNKSCIQALGNASMQTLVAMPGTPDQTGSSCAVKPDWLAKPYSGIARRQKEIKKIIKMQDGGNIEIVIRYG